MIVKETVLGTVGTIACGLMLAGPTHVRLRLFNLNSQPYTAFLRAIILQLCFWILSELSNACYNSRMRCTRLQEKKSHAIRYPLQSIHSLLHCLVGFQPPHRFHLGFLNK